jgi:hypothetical protein
MKNKWIVNFKAPFQILKMLFILILVFNTFGQDENINGWPRELETEKGTVVLYQPQPESFGGDKLTARAAISVTPKQKNEPVFGAIWITSRVETDRNARTVTILDVKVDNVRFPDATEKQTQTLSSFLEKEIPQWELVISLDQLLATLDIVEKEKAADQNFNNKAPNIIYRDEPAVLVLIDGAPQLRDIENSPMKYIVNTPFPIVFKPNSNTYYLSGGDVWYKAGDPLGPWKHIKSPPKEVAAMVPKEEDERVAESDSEKSSAIPLIIVSTEPAELIVTEGKPKYALIAGTDLLYMSNTESDILKEITSQSNYVLLSGRWYKSVSMRGPWEFVPSDELPQSFATIPYDSPNGHLLAFVAGTEQAKEAVLDNQMPQTSTVNRKDASLEVTYDGTPKFEKIEGTDMEYAVNTAFSVLKINNRFYCCNDAVWYDSVSPKGPWAVSTKIPDDVQEIPPSNPNYNIKYVYIYDSTPDVVYIGYTPAYMGSYIYGPVVVYGTGYYYPPYWGPTYYYPRHATWGFHVRYNPYYGWSYGMSYSSGPFRLTVGFHGHHHHHHHGWYGPGRYHSYPHRSYHKTNVNVNRNITVNKNVNINNRRTNIYNTPANRTRNVQRSRSSRISPKVSNNRKNNVYSDKKGNVHRKTNQGWQSRQGGKWLSGLKSSSNKNLNRASQSRQRSAQRASRSRISGGMRRR